MISMKKMISIALAISMICILTACHHSEENAVTYSANLETDAFYNIGAYNSTTSDSPAIVSDKNNIGNVYIRLVDRNGGIVGSDIIIEPGETVTFDITSAFTGTYTIQGKAIENNGEYLFTIK